MLEAKLPLEWSEIEKELINLRSVEGGFSQAKRGLITLPNGRHVFAKLGLHEHTKEWAKKEIGVYRFLNRQGYSYIPELLAVNEDESGFALAACLPEDGWNWKEEWSERRLAKTLEALDALAAIKPQGTDLKYFSEKALDESKDGWGPLVETADLRAKLLEKLKDAGKDHLAATLNFETEAAKSKRFVFQNTFLVHNDLRADNCAWNPKTQEVRIVDWNLTQMGDRRIDLSATLTHIHKYGFDVLPMCKDRLDADALHWLAGYFLKQSAMPIWDGGPDHLRDFQLLAGMTALDLAAKISV